MTCGLASAVPVLPPPPLASADPPPRKMDCDNFPPRVCGGMAGDTASSLFRLLGEGVGSLSSEGYKGYKPRREAAHMEA